MKITLHLVDKECHLQQASRLRVVQENINGREKFLLNRIYEKSNCQSTKKINY